MEEIIPSNIWPSLYPPDKDTIILSPSVVNKDSKYIDYGYVLTCPANFIIIIHR